MGIIKTSGRGNYKIGEVQMLSLDARRFDGKQIALISRLPNAHEVV
jgi:hypothetical protein